MLSTVTWTPRNVMFMRTPPLPVLFLNQSQSHNLNASLMFWIANSTSKHIFVSVTGYNPKFVAQCNSYSFCLLCLQVTTLGYVTILACTGKYRLSTYHSNVPVLPPSRNTTLQFVGWIVCVCKFQLFTLSLHSTMFHLFKVRI